MPLWSGLFTKVNAVDGADRPGTVLHTFRTAGTTFPLRLNHLESEGLPPPDAPPSFQSGIASLIGGRRTNEDTALLFLGEIANEHRTIPICFAVVADGMGGHWGGGLASSIAAKTIAEYVISQVILSGSLERPEPSEPAALRAALVEAVTVAHQLVQSNVPTGGTTATCVLIVDDAAHVAHVGDSRAYLISDGHADVLTHDHLVVRYLEERGVLTAEQAESDPRRSVLYRAVGLADHFEVDTLSILLEPASIVLLCTDGLWGALDDSQLLDTIIEYGEPQKACDELVRAGAAVEGSDNVTAVLIQMPD